jgi:hypothetical protein
MRRKHVKPLLAAFLRGINLRNKPKTNVSVPWLVSPNFSPDKLGSVPEDPGFSPNPKHLSRQNKGICMDIISKGFDLFYDVVELLNKPFYDFFTRWMLIVLLANITCTVAFALGNRSIGVQWGTFVASIFVASVIPITDIEFTHRVVRAWTLVFCVIVLLVGPVQLSTLLFPRPKEQEELLAVFYFVLFATFVVNTLYAAYVQWIR